jgi:hypothetical protein
MNLGTFGDYEDGLSENGNISDEIPVDDRNFNIQQIGQGSLRQLSHFQSNNNSQSNKEVVNNELGNISNIVLIYIYKL